MSEKKKKSSVLRMMDNIKEENKKGEIAAKNSWKWLVLGKEKSGNSPRKKTIVGEGRGIKRNGVGLLEEALGGKTTAQSEYIKHPALKNAKKIKENNIR